MELFGPNETGGSGPGAPGGGGGKGGRGGRGGRRPGGPKPPAPLAERMRPRTIGEFVGQTHLLSDGRLLNNVLNGTAEKTLPSLILWGPPGTGKTTLARILAESTGAEFVEFSAVLSGVKDIREVVDLARDNLRLNKKTVLFVDEIHRFNKAQQDAFLHSVEDGTITLIGATTENPSFEVNAPLLSRCKVLVLENLNIEELTGILGRALIDTERGLGSAGAEVAPDVIRFIAESSHGDARSALTSLEAAVMMTPPDDKGRRVVTVETAAEAMQRKAPVYDRAGEEHYNVISVFIKSMRGSDPHAALYWLARMVDAGEDPLFIARRMVIFASEDVGNADPRALTVALGVKDAVHFVGMPEGWIPLAQGATYLATAPKSNASYVGYRRAMADLKRDGPQPVPLHVRNAPTKLMKELGYAKGYRYPHDYEGGAVEQDYLPDNLRSRTYYEPTTRGYERVIGELMEAVKKHRKKSDNNQ